MITSFLNHPAYDAQGDFFFASAAKVFAKTKTFCEGWERQIGTVGKGEKPLWWLVSGMMQKEKTEKLDDIL